MAQNPAFLYYLLIVLDLSQHQKCKDFKTLASSNYYYENLSPDYFNLSLQKLLINYIISDKSDIRNFKKLFILHYKWATGQVWQVYIILQLVNIFNFDKFNITYIIKLINLSRQLINLIMLILWITEMMKKK